MSRIDKLTGKIQMKYIRINTPTLQCFVLRYGKLHFFHIYFIPLFNCLFLVSGVECYVCSYSSFVNVSRADVCSEHHFQSDYVLSTECSHGCEVFTLKDVNGKYTSSISVP